MSSDAILSSMSHSLASMTVQKSVASVHTTQPKFVTGRIAAKRQTAGIVFTQYPKINILLPSGKTMN